MELPAAPTAPLFPLSGGAPPDVTPLFGEDIPIFYTLAHLHHRRLSAIVYATTFTSIIFVIYQLPVLIAAAIVMGVSDQEDKRARGSGKMERRAPRVATKITQK